jgi:hypothetical protein
MTYFLNVWVLAFVPSSVASLFGYFQPIVAAGVSWFWLSEPPTARTVVAGGIGGAAYIGGLAGDNSGVIVDSFVTGSLTATGRNGGNGGVGGIGGNGSLGTGGHAGGIGGAGGNGSSGGAVYIGGLVGQGNGNIQKSGAIGGTITVTTGGTGGTGSASSARGFCGGLVSA